MKIGLNFLPTVGPDDMTAAAYYADVLDLSELADSLGFSHVKTVEHHFCEWGGYSPDPIALLSAVAARTRRVRLVTGAVVPAFQHPVKLASSLSVLDNLSDGRLDAGFGRAFLPLEFEAFGVPLQQSRQRFTEGVVAVERLWREHDFRFEGSYHRFGPLPPLLPRPRQLPCPPIFVAATVTPESFVWAGTRGYHLMIIPVVTSHDRLCELLELYRQARADAGHRDDPRMHVSYHCYVAEDADEARLMGARHYAAYQEKQLRAYASWRGVSSSQYPGYEQMEAAVRSTSFEQIVAEGKVLIGDVDEVRAALARVGQLYPGAEVSLHVQYGTISHAEATRTVQLIGKHIIDAPARTAQGVGQRDGG